MDFRLSDEQEMFRKSVRDYVNRELPKSWARELEKDEHTFPHELFGKLADAGFHAIGISEEYGGQGGDIMTQMLLVFGLAFEIPLFVVMLNLVGVLPGRVLGRYRPWIVLGTFVFAAIATPSTDPFSMLFLAVPMLVLFGISEVITRAIDRTRARRAEAQGIPLDEASPL